MSIYEGIIESRRRHLLPDETLENIVKHAKMVKNTYPKYDYTKRKDIISYCVERLSGCFMFFGASPNEYINIEELDLFRREAHFFLGVIGYLVDNDIGRESKNGMHARFYTDLKNLQGGSNQVDLFLERTNF